MSPQDNFSDDPLHAKKKAWSGRFSEPVDAFVLRYTASFYFDQRLAMVDIEGSLAHAAMLAKTGVISKDDLKAIEDGMAQIKKEISEGTFPWQLELEDVHLNIEARLTALIGRNGTGKSTLLRAIAGLNPAAKGDVCLCGRPLAELAPQQRAATVSFVTTERVRIANLACEDVVALGRAPYTNWIGRLREEDRQIVHRALEQVGMGAFARICAKLEEELQGLPDDEQAEMLSSYGIDESGLVRIIRTGYDTLGLCSYFTAGPDEVRAWTIRKGWKAPQAAGVIHTDFERGFIRAEVISYDDYMSHESEAACRADGVLRVEGKEYVVQDGDVMHFLFNV